MGRSIEHLKEAIKINPDFYEAYDLIADILLNEGSYAESERWYNRSIDIINKKISMLESKIERALELKLFKEIKIIQEKIARTYKDISCIYHKMALISVRNKNKQLAIEQLTQSIETDRDNAESYYQLSKLTSGKKSKKYLDQAIDIDPEYSIQA